MKMTKEHYGYIKKKKSRPRLKNMAVYLFLFRNMKKVNSITLTKQKIYLCVFAGIYSMQRV